MKICPICSTQNRNDAHFCVYCGKKFDSPRRSYHAAVCYWIWGRSYCRSHPNFDLSQIAIYDQMSLHQLMQTSIPRALHLRDHKVDDRYFSQSEIREIFDKMHKRRYRCDFCDFWYVGWPHVILNQLNKERLENTSSFLACPTCHTFLFNGTHDQRWRVSYGCDFIKFNHVWGAHIFIDLTNFYLELDYK